MLADSETGGKSAFLLFLMVVSALLGACGFNKSGVVYPELLENTGWKTVPDTLLAHEFSGYAKAVRSEVTQARVPFVEENASDEIQFASPVEYQPVAECESTRGIAILVHGLSDSAFSMRDLAREVSKGCYIARTALLPGHGTKPGDLLSTRLTDWVDTVQFLITQANQEHEHVVAVGFSLGALLVMAEALEPASPIDAIVTVSPAFYLTTSPWAEMAAWLHPMKTWLDKEKPDDTYRYEAIPTIAVAQTVRAKSRLHQMVSRSQGVSIPWLAVQSDDDLVIETSKNETLFLEHALNEASRLLTYYGESAYKEIILSEADDSRLIRLATHSEDHQVSGLTHVAIHQSPENHHYGVNGDYRNCGSGGPRPRSDVRECEEAGKLWLGPWDGAAPDDGPYGLSTYNPHFAELSLYINQFLDAAWRQLAEQHGS